MTRLDHERVNRNKKPKDIPRDPINDAPRPRWKREKRHPLLGEIARHTRELDIRIGLSSREELKKAIAALVKLIRTFYAEEGHGATEISNAHTVIERVNDKTTRGRATIPKVLPGPGPFRSWKAKAVARPKRVKQEGKAIRKRARVAR